MTIITKAISEKKASEKMEQPLFVEETTADSSKTDPEAQVQKPDVGRHYFVARRNIHRIHVTATFSLFLIALMILIIGVIGGLYIYIQYARAQIHRFRTGWYSIPYDKAPYGGDTMHQTIIADSNLFKSLTRATEQEAMDLERNVDNNIKSFLKERFEIDLENEHYEKIDVPDFRGGRQGRFIHDFNINKTGIIDIDGRCCFVMPLNRQRVLPPHNLYDLLRKMFNGYYEVDTDIVRETMKVVTPPITDMSTVGTYIARECQDLPTYMLKKVNPTVVKREASSGIFAQFAGKDIVEVDILNLSEFHK
ncbi:integral membrane protein 2A [Vespa crabro]|uniref:integral membrane protein 2A n=1 Tax=Vespa crabro TaxID=7445 RepID=UPI001F02FCF7|nr:integral membrane protein 2A [Vespa crabro]XP_046834482.1 integral membrane protein 2A [Vespa crabro]